MVNSIVDGDEKTSAYYCKKFFKKQLLFNHFVLPKLGISLKGKKATLQIVTSIVDGEQTIFC